MTGYFTYLADQILSKRVERDARTCESPFFMPNRMILSGYKGDKHMRLHVAIDTTTKDIYQHFSVLQVRQGIPEVIFIGTLWDWLTESEVELRYRYHEVKQIITRHKHPMFVI